MHPVGLRRELLHVHAVAPRRNLRRLRLGVLPQHAVMRLQIELLDLIVGAERVELGPAVEVLEGIVRAVVRTPAQEALDVAAIVVVLPVELAAGRHLLGEETAFEHGPGRRRHRRVDDDGRRCRRHELGHGEQHAEPGRAFQEHDGRGHGLLVRRTVMSGTARSIAIGGGPRVRRAARAACQPAQGWQHRSADQAAAAAAAEGDCRQTRTARAGRRRRGDLPPRHA